MIHNGNIVQLTDGNFDQSVDQGLTLVDFWAPWCGPCRMLGPVLDELAGEVGDGVRIGKVNVDDQPHLAARFQVQAIPLLVLMKDGLEIARFVGLRSKAELAQAIARAAQAKEVARHG